MKEAVAALPKYDVIIEQVNVGTFRFFHWVFLDFIWVLPKWVNIISYIYAWNLLGFSQKVTRLKSSWYPLTKSSNIGWTQRAFTCPKLTMESSENVKYVQS